MVGAIGYKILDQIEAVLPAACRAQPFAQRPAFAAQHVAYVDHACGEIDDSAAKKAIGAERREIHLHAFGAAIGFDKDRAGMKPGGKARLPVGGGGLAAERDQERRAEADDQRHHQACGFALEKPAARRLTVTGHARDQARRAR